MSEFIPEKNEQLSKANAIAGAIENWLSEEIVTSSEGENAFLDNWDTFLQDGLAKANSHFDRLKIRTDSLFDSESVEDEVVAMQIYDTQSGMSGAFRTQCYILAADHEDYFRRRLGSSPLNVDIKSSINEMVSQKPGNQPSTSRDYQLKINKADLLTATHSTNMLRLKTMEKISKDKNPKFGTKKAINALLLTQLQQEWLNLSTDYILYAAQLHDGDLSSVPFFEPKPINKARIYYPFRPSV
jgi:hypothetical protein